MSQYLTTYDLVNGKTLAERYTIAGVRRQSGFAAVYEASDGDGGACEVSLFPSGLFDQPEQSEQFRARLLMWKQIACPNVLAVREVVPVAGGLLLVTELPEGEPLRERLDAVKRFTPAEVVALGTQLCEGLARIHAAGLVHGDIKPRTIHVAGRGSALTGVLVDGGVTPSLWSAKGLGEKTALIGTPYYAPVEQFGGDAPDVRSDVYNVATVLYECITGVLPWAGKSFLEIFQAKLKDPLSMRSRGKEIEVDDELDSVVRHGCFADRRRRYGSAAEFKAALDELR
jgi:serine/threonine-protein kinase